MSTFNKIACRTFGLLLFAALIPCSAWTQKKKDKRDQLSLIREFVQISNPYQQLPVSAEFEVKQATNFIQREQDTATAEVMFYLDNDHCFMRLGETEQIVDDSMALLVSNDMQRMFLYDNHQPVQERVKRLTAIAFKDSSVQAIAQKYNITTQVADEETSIVLDSKETVYNSTLPKETIAMTYDAQTRTPSKTIMIKRTLLPLEQNAYLTLLERPEYASRLLAIDGKRFFLIKEQSTSFWFKRISHLPSTQLEVRIQDRINKNKEGTYVPVKGYEAYTVTLN